MPARESAARSVSATSWRRLLVIGLASPVALLDVHDLVFAQPEVMTELVDQGFADGDDDFVLVVLALLFDRPLIQRDAVRQGVAVAPLSLGERHALIQAKHRIRRLDLHLREELRRGVILDDDGKVAHLASEATRNRVDRLFDEGLELVSRHRGFLLATLGAPALAGARGLPARAEARAVAVGWRAEAFRK